MITKIARVLNKNTVSWIIPGNKKWTLDLDKLRESFPLIPALDWFHGKIFLEPEFELDERISDFDLDDPDLELEYTPRLTFNLLPEYLRRYTMPIDPPVEITESLAKIEQDHPDPNKVAFVMMDFENTIAHQSILKALQDVLSSYGIKALRADDKQYHDDLFWNIVTYIYGCGFGIAVFERILEDKFNPNVSLEVGYMLSLRKPVCLLKDKTLKTLHTDIVGKLYKPFDTQDPDKTIPDQIKQWLADKGFIQI